MKTVNLGINGFGRIGRIVFRDAIDRPTINIVAINDLLDIDHIAYLLKYDSIHGRFDGKIEVDGDMLIVNGKRIRVTSERDPKQLKWDAVHVDVVAECTGIFKTQEMARQHLQAGAKKVVISAPTKSDVPMFVMGVNHLSMTPSDTIVSNASCTTNCLAPLAQIIHKEYGIEEALMTTIHAATSTQFTVDGASPKNYRLGRSAMSNIIPTSTGAAKAVGYVIPELQGKLTGMAFRVPTTNVSVVDMTVRLQKETSLADIKAVMKNASKGAYKGVVGYTEEGVVSQDFVGDPRTSIFDADACIELNSRFFKLIAWYDNEYGYSSKLVDMVEHIHTL